MRVNAPAAIGTGMVVYIGSALAAQGPLAQAPSNGSSRIGREVAVSRHLEDGEEYQLSLQRLLEHGELLFRANWTVQEGAGRPFSKGLPGAPPLSDASRALMFPRNFNRISGPEANSCAGCHNAPFGIAGGGGDAVTDVFVLGQRFDSVTFDATDSIALSGAVDERGLPITLGSAADERATLGMFGAGYIELLARQMSDDLQQIRNGTPPGTSRQLVTKGVSFGIITRRSDGTWDTSGVQGLSAPSLITGGPDSPPSLLIRPFHQAGNVISLRQFSINAFNQHHGIQPEERVGRNVDADGDGFVNEMTIADVTAVTLFQATLAVPGRVIPRHDQIERAVRLGERQFAAIGCASCHTPSLPLTNGGWVFTEPGPYNPAGTLSAADLRPIATDLTDERLPQPRLPVRRDVVMVPAYTDLKLHDICDGPNDPNIEPLDMNEAVGSPAFFAGNRRFLTRKLWGAANEPPYFHHGKYTTLREAVMAHGGEAAAMRERFKALPTFEQDSVIEFLKTLQVLPPGTRWLVVDEFGRPRTWD